LKTNFDIALPDFPEDDQWKPSVYFEQVARRVRRQPQWEVDRNGVGLGFFTFAKFMMWRDLDVNMWPNNLLLDHPLLNVLLGDSAKLETFPPLVPDDDPIDERIDLSKCIHVVNADSSQAVVIEETRVGRNLVVQGPPGTGKSQTITNIIASAIHNGKTILFVAEKTAALEVVYDRLREAGLGPLCLEMHSRKANKKEVFQSLEQALRYSGKLQFDVALQNKLASHRDKLNAWSSATHKPIGQTGRSAFDVMGLQSKLRAEKVRLLDAQINDAAEWSASKLSSLEKSLDRVPEIITKLVETPVRHPWFGTNIQAQSPFDADRLGSKLTLAVEKLRALAKNVQGIFNYIAEKREPSIRDAFATMNAFDHLAAVPQRLRGILGNPAWASELAVIENTIEEGERLTNLCNELDAQFRTEAWACDAAGLLTTLRGDGPSFFRRFSSRYRQATADLRATVRGKLPRNLEERVALLERLHEGQERRREFTGNACLLSEAFGPAWAGLKTPWADLRGLATWVRSALSEVGGAQLLTLAARAPDLTVFASAAEKLRQVATEARVAFDDVQDHVQADFQAIFGTADYRSVPISRMADRASVWLENMNAVNDWVEARNALSHLRSEGLGIIVDRLMNGSIHPAEARPVTDLLISESLWRKACVEVPEIVNLDGNIRTHHVVEFCELDREWVRAARHEVLKRYLDQRPDGYAGEMGIIRAEINKKRRHRAVRKLMTDAGSAVQRLKPVFLMSPLSVAQFLPPGRLAFDLLVIDEASQVAPEDALGVIARAKQIVVVGDDKQLPPTNFFKLINLDDDNAEDDADDLVKPERPSNFESILTLSRTRGMSERMLAWHYRSKHPSLIALSNYECYAGRLLLPSSPFIQTTEFGLSFVQTPRGFYDRGGTSRDLVQAEALAKAIAEQIIRYPNKSLGVACLSAQQRDAVDDMIDKLGIRGRVEEFCPAGERLFVKNLEAVQGDERDVIFISIGYGVAQGESRPFLNFGPVSRDGGERRLNVLASRAREKCVVFSSITSGDIPADTNIRGTQMLRALLSYAETGKLGAGTVTGGDFESPFEEAVARVIREAGFYVHPQVGVSSFRIDLGVIDPAKPGEYILGVECDGAAYHSARSARDRDRLRQEILEERGWRLHRIWGTDWFRNPQRESERLRAAIEVAKGRSNRPTVQVTHDDDVSETEELPDAPDDGLEILSDGPDDSGILANTVEYKESAVKAPYRRDLLDLPVQDVARIALGVVEAEGPVHTEEVARRLREAFGLQKTGKRILAHVRAGLKYLSRKATVARDGEFWSVPGRELEAVRNRRNAALSLRRASMISPAEYQLALMTIVADVVAISRDDLLVETARLFGFDRTGAYLKEAIDREVAALVKKGTLEVDGDTIRLSAPQGP
jgi:very-short-patch-repair endonuclease